MRTKEKQMTDENTKYLIEFQTSLLKIIANRDQEMEDLKKQLEIVRSLHDYATKEQMILSRKVVEMGYNPQMKSISMKGFKSLEEEPLEDEMIAIYNDTIWND